MKEFSKERIDALKAYIDTNLPGTIHTVDDQKDIEYPVNYPYTSPCSGKKFRDFYYWDTYFICLGLVHLQRWDLIYYNIKNCFDLIDRFGYVPNYNRYYGSNRSQPPFLVNLVDLYYKHSKDLNFLKDGVLHLEKELTFWYSDRGFANGLSHYGVQPTPDKESIAFYEMINKTRVKYPCETEEEKLIASKHFYAEAESGWDFNPRFNHHALDYAAVDLNCNLYAYEVKLAEFFNILGMSDKATTYLQKATQRKELLDQYLWDSESGLFLDYNVKENHLSSCQSMASFFALYQGVATKEQAQQTIAKLEEFLYPYGFTTCLPGTYPVAYQWDYPNGWPCLQIIGVRGLLRYGYIAEAHKAATAFLSNILDNFEASGHLWEKYNVVEGTLNVSNEYELPIMLGWTAAAALDMMNVLGL